MPQWSGTTRDCPSCHNHFGRGRIYLLTLALVSTAGLGWGTASASGLVSGTNTMFTLDSLFRRHTASLTQICRLVQTLWHRMKHSVETWITEFIFGWISGGHHHWQCLLGCYCSPTLSWHWKFTWTHQTHDYTVYNDKLTPFYKMWPITRLQFQFWHPVVNQHKAELQVQVKVMIVGKITESANTHSLAEVGNSFWPKWREREGGLDADCTGKISVCRQSLINSHTNVQFWLFPQGLGETGPRRPERLTGRMFSWCTCHWTIPVCLSKLQLTFLTQTCGSTQICFVLSHTHTHTAAIVTS